MTVVFGKVLATGELVELQVDANGVIVLPSLPAGSAEVGSIQSRGYGWIGGAWQKGPLSFGYSGRVVKRIANTNLSAGTNILSTTPVPAGEIHVYTQMTGVYIGTFTNVYIEFTAFLGSVGVNFYQDHIAHSADMFGHPGWWVLMPGDILQLYVYNATAGDDAYFDVSGFRIDIDQ